MPRFLSLKSYLTTNRSNINKQDTTKFRRSRLSEREILRENVADKLKCPLCFCVPCFIGVAVMLVFIVLYVTVPHQRGLNFEKTECTVQKVDILKKGSCSLKTERFSPCYQIMVKYNTTTKGIKLSVLMENEQTLFHCAKCSYTFEKGSLFTKTKCSSSRSCLEKYHEKYGRIGEKYACFYDPEYTEDVFREYKISRSEAIYQTLLPALFIFLFILAFLFVQWDERKRRKLNEEIQRQKPHHITGTRRHKTDIPSCSTDSSETPSSTGSTAAMYRVRKRKMPCTKSHTLYTRDMEDVIMEEKPISPVTHSNTTPDLFMQVNVNKLKTQCACDGHVSLENHFELSREKENFRPVMASQHYYHNQLQRSRRALRYLPESVV
ncbi:uncharacterized protein LOC114530610 [Dendronephthya gigantea]|uniref:uncharacterized protein LOC114530610 n=1 Tax=Dendronephthya gigantea TaxID=151771 RepID=UPI00106BD434|nr:uncharacterized protein LOC114530610 [Dendronephthya gigantea]